MSSDSIVLESDYSATESTLQVDSSDLSVWDDTLIFTTQSR